MADVRSLAARIMLSWGLILAPLAFRQQSVHVDVLNTPAARLRQEKILQIWSADASERLAPNQVDNPSGNSVAAAPDGKRLADVQHVEVDADSDESGETRRFELLTSCVKSMGALNSVDLTYVTESELPKPPQHPDNSAEPRSSSETSLSAEANVASEPEKAAVRQTGTVKFYNTRMGYGFIKPDDGGNDIFVHVTAVERSGIGALVEGMRISFKTEPDPRGKGLKAVNLQKVFAAGTGTAKLPEPGQLPEKTGRSDVESNPKRTAIASSPAEEEWTICASSSYQDSQKAIEACTNLIAQGDAIPASRRAEAFHKRGQVKEQLLSLSSPGRTQQAKILEDYTAAIELDQSRPLVYLARALLTVNMGGDRDRAIADLSEVIRLDPRISRAYHVRGRQYAKKGDLDRALVDVTKSLELAPDSVAYEFRAELYEKKDQLEAAFADFDAAAGLAPKNSLTAEVLQGARDRVGRPLAKYHADRGQLASQNGDTDLAILDFNAALGFDRKNWRANFGRGAIYAQRDDLNNAEADLRIATQQFARAKPSDWPAEIAAAHVLLGEIYEKQRRLSDALLEYDEALKTPNALNDAEGIRARADRLRSQVK